MVSSLSSSQGRLPLNGLRDARIHLVGVGGTGMSGLAAFLARHHARVSGSDQHSSSLLESLREAGVAVRVGHEHDLPDDVELVVASAAIPAENAELVAARERGIPILKYAQMLGEVMRRQHGIGIAGTHGKSTSTAWLTYVLREAGLSPSFVIGAVSEQLGSGSGAGEGRFFVAEACEYDRSFLNLTPRSAAILNIEEDHLDCYKDIDAICAAFRDFARLAPADGLIVLNNDDPRCRTLEGEFPARLETFGCAPGATWRAVALQCEPHGCYSFSVVHRDQDLGRVTLSLAGRHNVMNGLAVIALAHDAGVTWDQLRPALESFRGVGRRLELRGVVNGVSVLDDYAHHPTEIRATLAAARERYHPRRLFVIFQPHQHSRTRFLLEDFARSFSGADEIIVPDIYFVRDSERDRAAVNALDLVTRLQAAGRAARYLPEFGAIVDLLASEVQDGDVVITMGAGDIWRVADRLVQRLRVHLPV